MKNYTNVELLAKLESSLFLMRHGSSRWTAMLLILIGLVLWEG